MKEERSEKNKSTEEGNVYEMKRWRTTGTIRQRWIRDVTAAGTAEWAVS